MATGLLEKSTLIESQIKKFGLSDYRRVAAWQEVEEHEWNDWRWQIKNRVCTIEQLSEIISVTKEEQQGIKKSSGSLSLAITPYWAMLMDVDHPNCPIRRQAVPLVDEHFISPNDMVDPCAEDRDSPAPGLVHRYPDRVLLLATERCPSYCRHCTRRRIVGDKKQKKSNQKLDKAIEYIKSNRKIRDVLISGGDPLMLNNEQLEEIIKAVRSISHVEFIRIGTRAPVTLPQRIDEDLIKMLKKYNPIWISIHINHYRELTRQAKEAIDSLADGGMPLGSQTVLLKGINDKPWIMRKLMQELIKSRVRPYYIYQCDPVQGTSHFRTPVAVGINIIEKLRGHTTGYAVPTYVIDAPGGGGKIPLGPT